VLNLVFPIEVKHLVRYRYFDGAKPASKAELRRVPKELKPAPHRGLLSGTPGDLHCDLLVGVSDKGEGQAMLFD
jgi:hypothetical protein